MSTSEKGGAEAESCFGSSVVIPAYGSSPALETCIEALELQTMPAAEIIVFHSGSDDPTQRIAARFPHVKSMHSEARKFAGAARNNGAEMAHGAWLAFLDSDMVAKEDWLATLGSELESHPDDVLIGAVGKRPGGGIWGLVMWYIEFGSVFPHRRPQFVTSGPSANFAMSRARFEAAGGFRGDLYAAEDGEFFLRLRDMGSTLRLVPTAVAEHKFPGGIVHSLRRLIELGRAAAFLRRGRDLPGALVVRRPSLALVLPFARLLQMARRLVVEKGPLLQFLLLSPFIFLGLAFWSYGFWSEARRPTYPSQERDA